jgi:hypothetical protein
MAEAHFTVHGTWKKTFLKETVNNVKVYIPKQFDLGIPQGTA